MLPFIEHLHFVLALCFYIYDAIFFTLICLSGYQHKNNVRRLLKADYNEPTPDP